MHDRAQQHHGDGHQQFRAPTPWGDAVITTRGRIVAGVRPPLAARAAEPLHALASAADGPPEVAALAEALAAYLAGAPVELATVEQVQRWLGAAGVTGFARDASLALLDVPRGVTISYGDLATLAGRPGAARAVGVACARTPLPIVVPVHRVVRAGARHGDVGPYGGGARGVAMKRRLLELEDAPLVRARARE